MYCICMYVRIYIFVCMYIMYAYVCICACKDVYNIHMRTYVHTYIIHAHIYKYNLYACMYARILCMYVCIHVWLYVCTFIHIRMYALIEMIMVVGKLSRREYILLKTGDKYSPRGIYPRGKFPVETVRFPAHCTCMQGRTSHRGMKQKSSS